MRWLASKLSITSSPTNKNGNDNDPEMLDQNVILEKTEVSFTMENVLYL